MNASVLLLERLSALINQSLREDAARHGLLPVHMQALAYLAVANQYSDIPIAVAEYFGTTRGTVSQTLAVLERKGLIRKVADPHHGKRIHLHLTDVGQVTLASSWSTRLETALAAVDQGPADFPVALHALLIALQRLNQNHAFGVCRQCSHFLREADGACCGLTGEPLDTEQTEKVCREWRHPMVESEEQV